MVLDRFYNTPARQGFHWPGRILSGPGVLEAWLKDAPAGLAIVADRAFAAHPLVVAAGGAACVVDGEPTRAGLDPILSDLAARRPSAILALGGGATIDSAKALAAHLRFGSFDIRDRPRDATPPLLIAAPTTAGSGSETSRFFILADASAVKISTRSWSLVPDLTLLDPLLLESLGPAGLLLGAFDAAIHLWETHVARGEASAFTDGIAQAHLPHILAALPGLAAGLKPDAATRQALMEASAMAGVAISNVRTGLIHTLGESLAAQCHLPHPLTLRVFLPAAMASYSAAIAEKTQGLWRMADALAPRPEPWSPETFTAAWTEAFTTSGLDQRIATAFAATPVSLDHLCTTAARDTTLAKENPLPLDANALRLVAAAGLGAWPAPLRDDGMADATRLREVRRIPRP
ncbi:MAG: iron-containing alcohol dehydrogenase [Alphaproteobacteria bacterium]|nr:iron-containing alcohol dehydrogenase [Alphaproteobacteria bacterium]